MLHGPMTIVATAEELAQAYHDEYAAWLYVRRDEPKPEGLLRIYHDIMRDVARRLRDKRPTIVCLCGSTRFWRTFQEQGLKETLAGKIVLSIGSASGSDADHFRHLTSERRNETVRQLNELHRRKIDMADEILVLDVNGYIGSHTEAEIEHAIRMGKTIRYLSIEQSKEEPSVRRERLHTEEPPGQAGPHPEQARA